MVLRNLLSDLATDRVVVLSTHIASDIESVASDIAIMAGGRLRVRGAPRTRCSGSRRDRCGRCTVPADALQALRERHVISKQVRTPAGMRVRVLAPRRRSRTRSAVGPGS